MNYLVPKRNKNAIVVAAKVSLLIVLAIEDNWDLFLTREMGIVLSVKLFWGQNCVIYYLVCDLVKSISENTLQQNSLLWVFCVMFRILLLAV